MSARAPARLFLLAPFVLTVPVASQPDPQFEVASIRPVPPGRPPVLRSQDFTAILPGGRFHDSSISLMFLIAFAHDVRNPSRQLVGLPNWAQNQVYSVIANPPEGFPVLPAAENREQVRLMLRHLLATRFELKIHTEVRQENILALRVSPGGMKLREVAPPVPPAPEGRVNAALSDSGGRIIAQRASMRGLAAMLALFVGSSVQDETGLPGYYDMDIRWSAPEPPPGHATGGLGADGVALLISAIQSEFGLQLAKIKGPVTYWVVDRVNPPTEN